MEQKTTQRKRIMLFAVGGVVLLVLAAFVAVYCRDAKIDALYAAAVEDAVTAQPDEIAPLVTLEPSDPMTTWDSEGRVLLLSWCRSSEPYTEGADMTLDSGEIWTFTDREIAAWYAANKAGVSDWELRLEQLIGLPPDAAYTQVAGFWADPADVVRPAYVADVTQQMQLAFPADTDPAFQQWFAENTTYSYETSAYPWTRLGYTYDWADNGREYGLTEFLIEKGAPVQIAFVKPTAAFLAWLQEDAPLDAAA